MRSKIRRITSMFLGISLLLAGCTFQMPDTGQQEENVQEQDIEIQTGTEAENAAAQENTVIVFEKEEEEADKVQTLPSADLAEVQQNLVSEGAANYAYEQLTAEEQLIYSEILGIIVNMQSNVQISTIDTELIDKAFTCVMLDHPEIFYLTGYSITKYTRGSTLEKITLSGTYTMDQSKVAEKQLAIDAYTDKCLAGISPDADEYEKVKYVYEYIIKNTEYDLAAPDNQNILSVFEGGRSVCQGYAKATQYLLNKLNVFCTLVEGRVKDREAHVWNLVRINGSYCYVDTTWGDASYNLVSDGEPAPVQAPEINYDYLCVPERMIAETHIMKETVPMPECDSMENNYYVREGIYFETVEDTQLAAAFSNAYEQNKTSVTLKCSDTAVYDLMCSYLIKDEKIFTYLKQGESVSYVEMPEQQTLLFYL